MHLVALPKESEKEEKDSQLTQLQAYAQIEENKQFRYEKKKNLSVKFSDSLPKRLSVESVLSRKLAHKLDSKEDQIHLLEHYYDLNKQGFSIDSASHDFLKTVYGLNSKIYTYEFERYQRREREIGTAIEDDELIKPVVETKLRELDCIYWDRASNILVKSEAWGELSGNCVRQLSLSLFLSLSLALSLSHTHTSLHTHALH